MDSVHSDRADSGTNKPTFEERYGPWICMGCGYAHKLEDDCPCPHDRLNEDGICRRCGADKQGIGHA